MSKITEEEIKKILPLKGPSFKEVRKYLDTSLIGGPSLGSIFFKSI